MLLAIDTSLGTAVAVVDRDGGVLAEASDPARVGHVQVIADLIQRVLEESQTEPSSLSGVALGMGPGPASSLDIGIAAARGFSVALRKPVVRIMSHDAVALDRPGPTLVVTDVTDGMTAATTYDAPDDVLGLPVRVGEPRLFERGARSAVDDGDRYDLVAAEVISAGAVGMLAERLFAGKRSFARKEPYYVPASQ